MSRYPAYRFNLLALAFAVALALALWPGAGHGMRRASAGTQSGGAMDTTTLQLPILPDNDNGLQIGLPITVAGGASQTVQLDTGSTGLRIFASAVGSTGLQTTTQQLSVQYGDGTVFAGVLAYAPITVSGSASSGSVAFHLVESVGCAAGYPNCPGKSGAAGWANASGNVVGIAGVGLRMHPGAPDLISVFNQLPGNLASGWTLDTGGFGSTTATGTLGLTQANRAGYTTVPLGQEADVPATFSNGTAVWEDRGVNVCYTVGVHIQGCWPTTFDIGAEVMVLSPPPGGPDMLQAGAQLSANPGTTIAITLQGVFNVSFPAGGTTSENVVSIVPATPPAANTGIQFFFRYALLYDPVNGQLGFRQIS